MKDVLRQLASVHAPTRLAELTEAIRVMESERRAILRVFPQLRYAQPVASPVANQTRKNGKNDRRTAPFWTRAQRKAVSVRMKKYWAERRNAAAS